MNVQSRQPISTPQPPEKGSFPLDHHNLCGTQQKAYRACLETHNFEASQCKEVAKMFLECRMQKYMNFLLCVLFFL